MEERHGDELPFGAILFDDTGRPERGWLSIEGDEGQRFEGLQSLPGASAWLSNLRFEEVREHRLQSLLPLLLNTYLKEECMALYARHNCSERRKMAELGAILLGRVLRLSRAFLGDPSFLPKRSLRQGFGLSSGFEALLPEHTGRILESATYYNVNSSVEDMPGREDVLVFRMPWREHALAILQGPMPFGPVDELSEKELPSGGRALSDFLLEQDGRPAVYHVQIEELDEEAAALLAFEERTASRGFFPQSPRWLTHSDLMLLHPRGRFLLRRAFFWESSVVLSISERISRLFPPETELSTSCQLLFENLWHGHACRPRRGTLLSGRVRVNPLIPFIRAYDRRLLFKKASSLRALGIPVLGFANGRIRVDRRGFSGEELFSMSEQTGLLPPFLGLDEDTLRAPSASDPLSFPRVWYASGNLAAILDVDRVIFEKMCARLS
ncbi:MAG: hypothetical protein K5657_04400 [Desulfovibrio sp.]|nr:hypothetical protein [Desulfovibrio sp.]